MSIAFQGTSISGVTRIDSSTPLTAPHNSFSAEAADRLLEKLSSDDDFRSLFESNPRAALLQVGHVTPEDQQGLRGTDPVMCLNLHNGLASKEVICAGRERIKVALTSTQVHIIFDLSAS